MKAIQKFVESFGMRYEQFKSLELSLANKNITLPVGTCLYFNLSSNTKIDEFFEENYLSVIEDFSHTSHRFVFFPKLEISQNLESILKYYIPALTIYTVPEIINKRQWVISKALHSEFKDENSFLEIYKEVLSSIDYIGNAKCGFLICDSGINHIIELNPNSFFFDSGNFYEAFILFLKSKVSIEFHSRNYFYPEPFKDLDEQTKSKLEIISRQLEEIRNSGQLLLAMPAIRSLIHLTVGETRDEYSFSISSIYIEPITNNIFLPDFNNIEVKMSHLTKAVYLLFFNNPEGIDLQELKNYKNELQNIYMEICPFEDLEKVMRSIADITNIETKAIYTHISRIKSAFMNVMDYEFAEYYIVKGDYHGDPLKYIYYMKHMNGNPFADEDEYIDWF